MDKVITTISEYNLEMHKLILGVNTDKNGNEFVYQPERLNPEALVEEAFFPPPWNFYDHPEKTEGWIEFQRAMRKDPKYYLQGCDSLNSMET